jgi:hypothetical protein
VESVIFFDQIGAMVCGGLHLTLVPGKDWLLLSQVFEGPHFKKAAMTSKKLSVAQRHMPPTRIPPIRQWVRPLRFPLEGESLPVSRLKT